jgi:segregation and condensation protein A
MFSFKVDKFEGPLGLLAELIEREEMDITEICLAKIADQYIDYVESSEEIEPEEMADFLVVAAKLLLIKSRALLPFLKNENEEEVQEFEEQLRMYKEFLEAAKKIEAIIGERRFGFEREFSRSFILANAKVFSPPQKLSAQDLAKAFAEIIRDIEPPLRLEEERLEVAVNIEDKILAIRQILVNHLRVSFNHILASAQNKTEIIVSFLALLELVKQKSVAVVQGEMLGEIEVGRVV